MNVLFLVSRYYYEQQMSRCRFHQMAAVGRCEDVRVTVWGKGFPNYRDEAPLYQNIKREFGSTAFDLIHVYKPFDHKAVAACPIPKSIDYNEAWDRNATLNEIIRNDIRLVVFHHENDFEALKTNAWLACERLLVHIPHSAERSIFEPAARQWKDRAVPVLLTGCLSTKLYPFRVRCAQLMRAGRLPGEIRSHPGYRTVGFDQTRDQFADYAQHLGRARIAMVLGIKFDYALAKYPEAAMAGCLIIGDVPRELTNTLGPYMVKLDPHMPDEQIVKEVRWWVEHDNEAQALAVSSQKYALSQLTMERYADEFVSRAREFLDQEQQRQPTIWARGQVGRLRWAVDAWLGGGRRA